MEGRKLKQTVRRVGAQKPSEKMKEKGDELMECAETEGGGR